MDRSKLKKELIWAFTHGNECLLPQDIVYIILEYTYDLRAGDASVQYWLWVFEPRYINLHETNRIKALRVGKKGKNDLRRPH